MNYYNENDPKAAAWLRELIDCSIIPFGVVDTRSIVQVQPDDLDGFTQCHFFAGIGGWPLALSMASWPEDRPVWTGSCPCQPFSDAGKGAGEADPRHLWPAWFRLIEQCGPREIFGEQVASKAALGWYDGVSAGTMEYRLTWKARVTPQGRLICALRASGRRTSDSASIGLPATPEAAILNGWASPNAIPLNRGGLQSNPEKAMERRTQGHMLNLDDQATFTAPLTAWPSPMAGTPATDKNNEAGNNDSSRKTVALVTPGSTPSSRDWKDTPGMATIGTNPDGSQRVRLDQLPRQAALTSGPTSNSSTAVTGKSAVLNPDLSHWLMGYPAAWLSCGVSAMRSIRRSRRSS